MFVCKHLSDALTNAFNNLSLLACHDVRNKLLACHSDAYIEASESRADKCIQQFIIFCKPICAPNFEDASTKLLGRNSK